MSARTAFAKHLTAALLACDWTPGAMIEAAQAAVGGGAPKLVAKLVSQVRERTVTPYAPPPQKLTRTILDASTFERLFKRMQKRAQAAPVILASPEMAPLAVFRGIPVPQLATPGDLAAWLEVEPARLAWFADIAGRLARDTDEGLQHYRYSWAPKRTGPPRLIEAPKADMKRIQRRILHEILDPVPPHDCAHGFRKGRSCLSYAQQHAGESIVVALDLKEFFLNVSLARVHGLFRCLGYPWAVARLLTGLCSASTPWGVFRQVPRAKRHDWTTRSLYHEPHLPQGAPTSPAIANLCSWRLDHRLNGLARRLNARYTRYADDLAFSGDTDLARQVDSVLGCVGSIVREEGHSVNRRKTRVMRQGQRQYLTGLVVNQHVNVARPQFDALKATLHNCARLGPDGQNRDRHPDFRRHLEGRITWMENVNLRRAEKLRTLFDRIDWSTATGEG